MRVRRGVPLMLLVDGCGYFLLMYFTSWGGGRPPHEGASRSASFDALVRRLQLLPGRVRYLAGGGRPPARLWRRWYYLVPFPRPQYHLPVPDLTRGGQPFVSNVTLSLCAERIQLGEDMGHSTQ